MNQDIFKEKFDNFFKEICPSKEERLKDYICLGIIIKILEQHNIPYFAHSGTMLGCVRHKGFIPWDDDADIMVEEKYKTSIINLSNEINKFGIELSVDENSSIQTWFNKINKESLLLMDIFSGSKVNIGNKIALHYQAKIHRKWWPNRYVLLEEVYPLKKYKFGPLEIWGMNNPYPYFRRSNFSLNYAIMEKHNKIQMSLIKPKLASFRRHGLYPITNPKYLNFQYDFDPLEINLEDYKLEL